jgi:geranylgeranyl diphosphate synthase type II
MDPRLKAYFDRWRKRVDQFLDRCLPSETEPPRTIHKAMRYSVFAGGKRLRPVLVIASAETCGLEGRKAMPTACALELIHTYSLIHDDLPAMDDDDLRRGMPTNHKVFGEAIAILAGDALLTHAFNLIAKNDRIPPSLIPRAVEVISHGAGSKGMVGGQVADIEMGGGKWTRKPRKKRIEILRAIHERKTAALIQASILAGAVLGGASGRQLKRLSVYGQRIGLAFQIADDILDVVGNKKILGKKGSDRANRKLTYPAVFGLEGSRRKAALLIKKARESLEIFGNRAEILKELADYIVERTH